jgi:hypothetical protein
MKKVLLILLLTLGACKKVDIQPTPPQITDIFSVTESTVDDNSDIPFKLNTPGIYIIKLVDKNTEQVIAKERINGKVGMNTIKIYTRTLPVKYLYLVLEDQSKTEIGRTTIKIN